MFISSIIDRELRVALRKHGMRKSRFRAAMSGVVMVTVFVLLGMLTGSQRIGASLHRFLYFFGLYYAIVPSARISVGLFCEERRNQTLELLFLTGMSPGELFAGKLLGGVVMAANDLLALAPMLAIPFFAGGVSLNLFLATIGCLPVLLLATVSVGTLASVWSRDDGTAMVGAMVLGAIICLAVPLPYYLGTGMAGFAPFSAKWLCLSPAYGAWLVGTNFSGASVKDFWISAGVTCVWAVMVLGVAAVSLGRNWRQPAVVGAEAGGWRGWWAGWLHGSAGWRADLRERVLGRNAFQWLAQQDRRPVLLAWGLMGGMTAIWLLGWAAWGHFWATPVNLYVTAGLLLMGMGWIKNYAAARPIGMERREGTLELLLTTPLKPEEMFEGQVAAMRAQFRPVRWALTGLLGVMMAGGFLTRSWTVRAVITYVLIWGFFFATGFWERRSRVPLAMWSGLNTGRPMMAVFYSGEKRNQRGQWWWWIWTMWNLRSVVPGLVRAGRFPTGSVGELVLVGFVSLVCFIIFAAMAKSKESSPFQERVVTEMRLIAREPLPDVKDPRFKKWMGTARSPMSVRMLTFTERMGGRVGRSLGRGWMSFRTGKGRK